MKKLILLSALVLISTSLFSCTADDNESTSKSASETKKVEINTDKTQAQYDEGPGDDPIIVPPPPPKK